MKHTIIKTTAYALLTTLLIIASSISTKAEMHCYVTPNGVVKVYTPIKEWSETNCTKQWEGK